MPKTLTQTRDHVRQLLQISAAVEANRVLSNTDIESILSNEVLRRLAEDVPLELVWDIAGDGTAFEWALPVALVPGFSQVRSVEFPAGQRTPVYLEADQWDILRIAAGAYRFRLYQSTPGAAETVRVLYTGLYTLDDGGGTTVPDHLWPALCLLGAAGCCMTLATQKAGSVDATLIADSQNYRDGQMRFRQQADGFMKQYGALIGGTDGTPPAYGTVDMDLGPVWPSYAGGGYLTHHRRGH